MGGLKRGNYGMLLIINNDIKKQQYQSFVKLQRNVKKKYSQQRSTVLAPDDRASTFKITSNKQMRKIFKNIYKQKSWINNTKVYTTHCFSARSVWRWTTRDVTKSRKPNEVSAQARRRRRPVRWATNDVRKWGHVCVGVCMLIGCYWCDVITHCWRLRLGRRWP